MWPHSPPPLHLPLLSLPLSILTAEEDRSLCATHRQNRSLHASDRSYPPDTGHWPNPTGLPLPHRASPAVSAAAPRLRDARHVSTQGDTHAWRGYQHSVAAASRTLSLSPLEQHETASSQGWKPPLAPRAPGSPQRPHQLPTAVVDQSTIIKSEYS